MVNFDKTAGLTTVHCFRPNSRATYCNLSLLSPQKQYLIHIYRRLFDGYYYDDNTNETTVDN